MKGLVNNLLNLIYPPSLYCCCCGNIIDESRTYNLCDHCITHIKWSKAGIKDINGIKTMACTEYGIYERTMIFSLKYNKKKYIARDIASIMKDRLSLEDIKYDMIIPVPMNKEKERTRGFNQAELISRHLAELLEKEHLAKALVREKDTAPMRGLDPLEREANIRNTFSINEKYRGMVEGKNILIIDDFFTTGSTARECKRALEKVNVGDIYFLSFATKDI